MLEYFRKRASAHAPESGQFAIAYAILLIVPEVEDIGEQLYRIATAMQEQIASDSTPSR